MSMADYPNGQEAGEPVEGDETFPEAGAGLHEESETVPHHEEREVSDVSERRDAAETYGKSAAEAGVDGPAEAELTEAVISEQDLSEEEITEQDLSEGELTEDFVAEPVVLDAVDETVTNELPGQATVASTDANEAGEVLTSPEETAAPEIGRDGAQAVEAGADAAEAEAAVLEEGEPEESTLLPPVPDEVFEQHEEAPIEPGAVAASADNAAAASAMGDGGAAHRTDDEIAAHRINDEDAAPTAVTTLEYLLPTGKAGEDEDDPVPKFSSVGEAKAVLEGFLFTTNEPLSVQKLCRLTGHLHPKTVRGLLLELQMDYDGRPGGLQVVEVAGGFQLATRPHFAQWMFRLHKHRRRSPLSPATLETLAIIAYKQPVTKGEVEAIRGVDSGGAIRTLQDLNLLDVGGRREVPGRPQLFVTTAHFLKAFGLNSIDDLPSIAELRNRFAEEQKLRSPQAPPPAAKEAPAPPAPAAGAEAPAQPTDAAEDADAAVVAEAAVAPAPGAGADAPDRPDAPPPTGDPGADESAESGIEEQASDERELEEDLEEDEDQSEVEARPADDPELEDEEDLEEDDDDDDDEDFEDEDDLEEEESDDNLEEEPDLEAESDHEESDETGSDEAVATAEPDMPPPPPPGPPLKVPKGPRKGGWSVGRPPMFEDED